MHETALRYGRQFFEKYIRSGSEVLEIGSACVANQPRLRDCAPENCHYVGVDTVKGYGVDQVLRDPYILPFISGCFDAVVCSSTLEHVPLFWVLFSQMCFVLKPGGYLYINVPSNGYVHRHPVDCWRFYPDAGQALTEWAERSGYSLDLIESFIGTPDPDIAHWEDFVAVWRKN